MEIRVSPDLVLEVREGAPCFFVLVRQGAWNTGPSSRTILFLKEVAPLVEALHGAIKLSKSEVEEVS